MGGTILPPTQREIESENRQLKQKLDNIASRLSRIINGITRPDKATLGQLKEIMDFIKPPKRAAMDSSESVDYQEFIETWKGNREFWN